MLEKDLKIIEKILADLNYKPAYITILLEHIVNELGKTKLENLTSQFIYSVLIFEEGRKRARQIADYFEDMKKTGTYRTSIQKYLDDNSDLKRD